MRQLLLLGVAPLSEDHPIRKLGTKRFDVRLCESYPVLDGQVGVGIA